MEEWDIPQMKREVESLQYQLAINREKSSITVTEWVHLLHTHTHSLPLCSVQRVTRCWPYDSLFLLSFFVGWWNGSRDVFVKIHFWIRSSWEPIPGWRRASVWSSSGHTHTHTHSYIYKYIRTRTHNHGCIQTEGWRTALTHMLAHTHDQCYHRFSLNAFCGDERMCECAAPSSFLEVCFDEQHLFIGSLHCQSK